jgi:hypothetical protein
MGIQFPVYRRKEKTSFVTLSHLRQNKKKIDCNVNMYSLSHSTRHLSIAAADLSPTPSGNTLFAIEMAASALYFPFFSCPQS